MGIIFRLCLSTRLYRIQPSEQRISIENIYFKMKDGVGANSNDTIFASELNGFGLR